MFAGQQREQVQVARAHQRVQPVDVHRTGRAVQVQRKQALVKFVAHRRQRCTDLEAVAAQRGVVAQQCKAQSTGGGQQRIGCNAVTAAEGAVHLRQTAQSVPTQGLGAVGVELDLARVHPLGRRCHHQCGGAWLRAGAHFKARCHAAQVVDEKDHAFNIAHLQHAAGFQPRQIGFHHLAVDRNASAPVQHHTVKPTFQHGNADAATAVASVGCLFGQVGIAQVVAQVPLQKACHLARGIHQIFKTALRADVRRRQTRQGGAQFSGCVVVHHIARHVQLRVVVGLAQFARRHLALGHGGGTVGRGAGGCQFGGRWHHVGGAYRRRGLCGSRCRQSSHQTCAKAEHRKRQAQTRTPQN